MSLRLFAIPATKFISPGHLPNNLTVEKIKEGNSNIRNPILVSYAAKGLLPCHGLGSGIHRALANWPHIEFIDDREGCLFKSTVHRKALEAELVGATAPEEQGVSSKIAAMSQDTAAAICGLLRQYPKMTTQRVAEACNISQRTVLRHLERLKEAGVVRRVGPTKGGRWEVLS